MLSVCRIVVKRCVTSHGNYLLLRCNFAGKCLKNQDICPKRPLADLPPNPCQPCEMKPTYDSRKYRAIALFIMFPLIFIQMLRCFGPHEVPTERCRDYEYMRIRTKRFPWGKGQKSLFHNDCVNYLPGECPDDDDEC